MTILAIIPARGGSKGLPGKNIKLFCGKPLIAWSILAAKKSKWITDCLVSTESTKIAKIAKRYGGKVPFLRPKNLAKDSSSILGVLKHAVQWFEKYEKKRPDLIILLQPTSPLRKPSEIDRLIQQMKKKKGDSAQTFTEDTHHPYHRYLTLKGKLKPFYPTLRKPSRRQLANKVYYPNGSIYGVRYNLLMKKNKLQGKKHLGIITPVDSSIDIDTLFDFKLAQWLSKK